MDEQFKILCSQQTELAIKYKAQEKKRKYEKQKEEKKRWKEAKKGGLFNTTSLAAIIN
jgi:hypothetical protein